jgi:hypothetical protein
MGDRNQKDASASEEQSTLLVQRDSKGIEVVSSITGEKSVPRRDADIQSTGCHV